MSNDNEPAQSAGKMTEAESVATHRDWLRKMVRLIDSGKPGVKQARGYMTALADELDRQLKVKALAAEVANK